MPEVGFIASTRVALGLGLGLLISNRLNKDQRKAAGWAALGVGILTSVPIAIHFLTKPRLPAGEPVSLVS
jgi:hypothetical protein